MAATEGTTDKTENQEDQPMTEEATPEDTEKGEAHPQDQDEEKEGVESQVPQVRMSE